MFERILVALDGSTEAERILPHVEALAARFDAEVTLLRAVTPPGVILASTAGADPVAGAVVDPTPVVEAERHAADDYLAGVVGRLRRAGIRVRVEEAEGGADEVLLQRARALGSDLIAMA